MITLRKIYEQPRVQHIGTVHELTLGSDDGNFTDQQFPVDTPKDDLTFSG